MTIRTRVVGYFLVVFLLFVGVSGYIVSRHRQANARVQSLHGFFLPLSREVAGLQMNVYQFGESSRKFFMRPMPLNDSSKARLGHPYRLQKKISELAQWLQTGGQQGVEKAGMFLEMLLSAKTTLSQLEAIQEKEPFIALFEKLSHQIHLMSKAVEEESQAITGAAELEGQQSLFTGLALSGILGCFVILSLLLSNRALKPLPDLIDSIRKIADGDFNQSLKVSTGANDELSILAREYNRALGALAERDKEIQKQQTDILQKERLAAVGQLSAEIVHEIRNPLNAISLNIDWLQHELQGTGEEISQVLSSISREVERLHQITEVHLVRARVPFKEGERAGVNEAIREVIEFCKEEDRSKNIEVDTLLAEEEFFIATDKSRFKQALLNILKNAKEAMPRGGKIEICTEYQNNAYRIQVKDSGSGMNPATRHHSFRPFFTTKPNGTGLGLSVTKSIVEEAHGSIQCESRLGNGTTVTLQFPC